MNDVTRLDQDHSLPRSGDLDRRAALKLFVSGAALALASCGRPDEQIVPYVDLPERRDAGRAAAFRHALCRSPDMAAASS